MQALVQRPDPNVRLLSRNWPDLDSPTTNQEVVSGDMADKGAVARRLKKRYLEEKLKAEIVAETLVKKWCGLLAGARWPNTQFSSAVFPSQWPAQP